MRRLYREAGCLGQRLREGIAARQSGWLPNYSVSVLKVAIGLEATLSTYRTLTLEKRRS